MSVKTISTAIVTLVLALSTATSASILEYNLAANIGTEASEAPSFVAPNIAGLSLTRGSDLTGSAATNSFSATGWDNLNVNDFFSFGLTINSGYEANVTGLTIATRSSNTGPGFLGLFLSVDGGPETQVASFTQVGTATLNSSLSISASADTSLQFYIRSLNTTSANGGTVAAAGTFRVANYFDGVNTTPIALSGSIVAVPEPSAFALFGVAGLLLTIVRRRQTAD